MDLPSHVYNAWLASLIAHGQVSGLELVHPFTNVLADWILSVGLHAFGAAWAARILCILAVETFFWGVFRLASVVSGKSAWPLAPCIAMLSYGFTFYLGFVNFYLATACSVWILAVLWRFSFRGLLAAFALGVVGSMASLLPVAWAVLAVGYMYAARVIPVRVRPVLLVGGAGCLVVADLVFARMFECYWHLDQIASSLGFLRLTGLGQFAPFGPKYLFVSLAILILWGKLFLERVERGGVLRDPLFHLWLLAVVAVAVLPSGLGFPMYAANLTFIPDRVSQFVAILFCAWLGSATLGRGTTSWLAAVAAVYFVFLYVDARALNKADAEITALVSHLPPAQRVVSSVRDSGAVLTSLEHVLDWACIGRCFDYGNYEPASHAFRVWAAGVNGVVTPSLETAEEIEYRGHAVTAAEAPLYSVCPSSVPGQRFALRRLEAGEKTCSFELDITPALVNLFW